MINKKQDKFWSTIKDFVAAIIVVLVFITFFFQHSVIPSGSMIPTTLIGDFLFVSKYSYGYSKHSTPFYSVLPIKGKVWKKNPQRGDVVVFRVPQNNNEDWIKRVIGIPGDTVEVVDGRVILNGEELPLRYVGDYTARTDNLGEQVYAHYKQTLPNGVEHDIIKLNRFVGAPERLDNMPEIKIPPKHYFMMGDNRDGSTDSRNLRKLGVVHEDQIVGKARIIFYSTDARSKSDFARWISPNRFKRIFTFIK